MCNVVYINHNNKNNKLRKIKKFETGQLDKAKNYAYKKAYKDKTKMYYLLTENHKLLRINTQIIL